MSPTPPGRAAKARAARLTLYAHPFEVAVAISLGATALRTLRNPDALIVALGPGLALLWVIGNIIGIVLIVVGVFGSADVTGDNPRLRGIYRGTEKAGLYLIAGATSGYAVLLAGSGFSGWTIGTAGAQLVAVAAACLLRAAAIRKAERIQLEELRRLHRTSATEYLDNLLRPNAEDDAEDQRDEEDG